jgi:hypothetical protein
MANPDVEKQIMDFQTGLMGEAQALELFQRLVDSGYAWQLGGVFSQMAKSLISNGKIRPAQ